MDHFNLETTMQGYEHEESKINQVAQLDQKEYSELVGGMRTGLNNNTNRKLASVREDAGMIGGQDLEQTYLNDEILLGGGLRNS